MTWAKALVVLAGIVTTAAPAFAQEQETAVRSLTGTLKKIRETGTVAIGYREASFPLSYVDPKGHPIGYAIDLCRAIVEQIGHEIDKPHLKTELVLRNPGRLPGVARWPELAPPETRLLIEDHLRGMTAGRPAIPPLCPHAVPHG